MILTLTLNPAVDVSLSTDRIIYDDRSYINSETYQAGGKGIILLYENYGQRRGQKTGRC